MLKKIVLTVAAMAALAGMSYAMTNPDFIENVPGVNFKTSNNVKVSYKNDTLAAPQAYAIVSKHTSGNTYYATSNIATTIMKQQIDAKMGVPLTLSDLAVTGVAAGDSLFTGGNVSPSSYTPM